MRRKLMAYSLNKLHVRGGPKAKGFQQILGITIESLDYLEEQIHRAIHIHPIVHVQDNWPFGVSCVVTSPLRGVGGYTARIVTLRTVWLLPHCDAPPRLTTAYLKP